MKEELDKLCESCVAFTETNKENCCFMVAGSEDSGVITLLGNKEKMFRQMVNAILDDCENRQGVTLKFLTDVVGYCLDTITESIDKNNEKETQSKVVKMPFPQNKYKS